MLNTETLKNLLKYDQNSLKYIVSKRKQNHNCFLFLKNATH